jgi:DNA-binding transcriptional ArsR family regulator
MRERFNLVDRRHIAQLTDTVQKLRIDFLILDVLNRMIPTLDEISSKDMAVMVSVLEELNRDLGLTILLLDHTRKPVGPNSGRNHQEPNPFDLKGSIAKYGCADFMICISRTEQDGRIQVYCENKDTDERPHFFVDVSPKDSGKPKFTWAGDVAKLASDRKEVGKKNPQRVLQALTSDWTSISTLVSKTGMVKSTVSNHLKTLMEEGLVQRDGENKDTKYRLAPTDLAEKS